MNLIDVIEKLKKGSDSQFVNGFHLFENDKEGKIKYKYGYVGDDRLPISDWKEIYSDEVVNFLYSQLEKENEINHIISNNGVLVDDVFIKSIKKLIEIRKTQLIR